MMIARPYQVKACDAIFEAFSQDPSTLVVMPTGTGKTVLFSTVIHRANCRAMVIAHRQELIWQARDKIERVTGLNCEVEMGAWRASAENGLFRKSSVVVSTVQTHVAGGDGAGRMTKFDPNDFGLLIIDEAHHATSPSYRKLIDWYRTNPNLRVLGVTATPDRADEEALGQVFDSVAFDYELLDAIRDGWLVPIDQQMVHVGSLDFSTIRTTAGDLNGADLAAVMEAEKNLQGVAWSSVEIIGNKRALVFTSSVDHARMLAEIFNRHRPGMASWVCGATDKEDRRRMLKEFQDGKIQVVCNCNVLTEGFDDPGVEVVIMARPTKSRALYAQMIGRATRPLPGVVDGPSTPMGRRFAILKSAKPACLVVDFVGVSGRHKLMTTADILGGKVSEQAIESAINVAKGKGKPVRMSETLDEEEDKIQQEKERRRLEDEARRARLVVKAEYKTQKVDPFNVLEIQPPAKTRGWDKDKVLKESWAQQLRKQGIDPDARSYGENMAILRTLWDRMRDNKCTYKQLNKLKQFGVDAKDFNFDQARQALDAIAANGWKKPDSLPVSTPSPEPQLVTTVDDGDPF